jgi:hypothetical protein
MGLVHGPRFSTGELGLSAKSKSERVIFVFVPIKTPLLLNSEGGLCVGWWLVVATHCLAGPINASKAQWSSTVYGSPRRAASFYRAIFWRAAFCRAIYCS